MGLLIDELKISTAPSCEISSELLNNDCTYASGDNTFFLLRKFKKTRADKIIKEQIGLGKLYIGESVRSIVLPPNVEYINDMDSYKVALL